MQPCLMLHLHRLRPHSPCLCNQSVTPVVPPFNHVTTLLSKETDCVGVVPSGHSYVDHLKHLNERDGEVEVDSVAEVQSEGHEEADRHDPQHVEAHGHGALDLHHMQHLQATTARVMSRCQATSKIHTHTEGTARTPACRCASFESETCIPGAFLFVTPPCSSTMCATNGFCTVTCCYPCKHSRQHWEVGTVTRCRV